MKRGRLIFASMVAISGFFCISVMLTTSLHAAQSTPCTASSNNCSDSSERSVMLLIGRGYFKPDCKGFWLPVPGPLALAACIAGFGNDMGNKSVLYPDWLIGGVCTNCN